LVFLVDIEVANFFLFRLSGREWIQRRASEECHLNVLREAMEAEKPPLTFDTIERRVPLHCLSHTRHRPHDESVESAPDFVFPSGHGLDIFLHGSVTIGLRDLRITAGENRRLPGLAILTFRS
jgi:hypothetical protein